MDWVGEGVFGEASTPHTKGHCDLVCSMQIIQTLSTSHRQMLTAALLQVIDWLASALGGVQLSQCVPSAFAGQE